ncbi:MAG TPA: MATE family efflux transporter [Saprospiraceae bacterium]|jgi:MATE family multidrug resistance protein|nr:MATE family efflux transporter [Saprospiraceae bacterium]HRO08607.1 MATE family efflux transporter [Saprospiraceae bacterium]HRP41993.1 MATE family efflux transporter [Saprospiraceae bacterium]
MSRPVTSLKIDTSVKSIILLTLPISMAKLIPELNYLFNAAFLGHLGSKELALAGITGVYYLVFASIGYGLNNALLSLMSRKAGEENRNAIFVNLWHGVLLGWILASVFSIVTWTSIKPIMSWAGIEGDSVIMAGDYLHIRIIGLFFLYTLQMQNSFLITIQKTRYLIVIAIVQSVANIALDYGMIFGHLGFPALGFNGAAYASVISEFIGMVTVMLVIFSLKITRNYRIRANFSISYRRIAMVFKVGYPLMLQLALGTASWWVFFILVSRNYTNEEQAVSQAMRNLFGLGGVFSWAFGSSTNTILSNLIGQKRHEEIFVVIRKLLIVSLSGMGVLTILLNIFPGLFFGLFGQPDHFVTAGTGTLRVVSLAMLFTSVGVIWLNGIIATGHTKIVLATEALGITVYLLFVWITIEVMQYPLEIGWMCEWAYWLVMIIPSYLYLKYGNWRKDITY